MDIEWFTIVDLIVETVVVLQWIYGKGGEIVVIGGSGPAFGQRIHSHFIDLVATVGLLLAKIAP